MLAHHASAVNATDTVLVRNDILWFFDKAPFAFNGKINEVKVKYTK